MFKLRFIPSLLTIVLWGCIGDDIIEDFIEEEVRIESLLVTLGVGKTYQLEANYFDNTGNNIPQTFNWNSLDETIATVSSSGLATGISNGTAQITVSTMVDDKIISDTVTFEVSDEVDTPVVGDTRTGTIRTTSSYVLQGDFKLIKNGNGLILELQDNFLSSDQLPGLYVYLTNNPTTNNGALEIGPVTQFSGKHSYNISNTDLNTYNYVLFFCKPFVVKVGDGVINEL